MSKPLGAVLIVVATTLVACGADTATTAASKAAPAKGGSQAKETLDRAKNELEQASQLEQQRADPLKEGY